MIVVKNINAIVVRYDGATHSRVPRTQIAIVDVWWNRLLFLRNCLATPWAILSMGRNDHPLFSQRVPTLFPNSVTRSLIQCTTQPLILRILSSSQPVCDFGVR